LGNAIDQTQYDGSNNVTAITDGNSNTTHGYYDLLNGQVLTVDPLGNNDFKVLNPIGQKLGMINSIGVLTLNQYDADGRQNQKIDPLMHSTQTVFDADGNAIQVIDGRGMSTRSLFDSDNRRTATIKADGDVNRQVFNADNIVIQIIDGNGHATNFTIDAIKRRIATTDADGNRWQIVFDAVGNAIEGIDANGNPVTATFDGDNRTTSVKDAAGNTGKAGYDGAGNVVQAIDQNGKITQYQYNKDNEQIALIDGNGHQQSAAFDKNQNQLATYDGNQNGTFSGVNADNQQTGSGLATGATMGHTYNALGAGIQVTDPDGNPTRYLYDQAGNLVASIDPLGHASYNAYNADNQVSKTVDRNGRAILYTYCPCGLLDGETWIAADGVTQTNVLTWNDDSADNLTSVSNSYGSYTLTYDSANRVLTQLDPFGVTLTLGYDANGNTTNVHDSLGGTLSSVYDLDNRLTSRRFSDTSSHQLRIDLTYMAISLVATETRYSDTGGTNKVGSTTNSYDAARNITHIQHLTGSGGSLINLQYSYDNGNRLSSETDTINGTPTTTNYGYDTSNQLTSAGSNNYSYDANGNRTMTGYQTGTGNTLLSDGTWNYSFDNEGNVAQQIGISNNLKWIYAFDNENHLTQATQYSYSGGSWALSQQLTYQYDIFGNRVEEDVYIASNNTTTVTKFGYVIAAEVRIPRGVANGTANNWADLNNSNQLVTRHLFLEGLDSIFARMDSSGTVTWYLSDHLGSIRGLMNNSSSLIDQITYDASGNISNESSPSDGDRYKFTGREWDAQLGQYYYRARYYSPSTGRFMNQDPIGFAGKDTDLYRYVRNSPTNYLDPEGTKTVGECLADYYNTLALIDAAYWSCMAKAVNNYPAGPVRQLEMEICEEEAVAAEEIAANVLLECLLTAKPPPEPSRNRPRPFPVYVPVKPDWKPILVGGGLIIIGGLLIFAPIPGGRVCGAGAIACGCAALVTNPSPAYAGGPAGGGSPSIGPHVVSSGILFDPCTGIGWAFSLVLAGPGTGFFFILGPSNSGWV
jgi:RHS repeat-associated protein